MVEELTKYLPSDIEFISQFIGEIALLAVLFVLRLIGIDFFIKFLRLYHYLAMVVTYVVSRRKFILLYTDADDQGASTYRLLQQLQLAQRDRKVRLVALKSPEDILKWPLSARFVDAVTLLISDVSPLSTNARTRDLIQHKLVKFVHNGGLLILGHDALYRRSRNHILQQLYGVTLTQFDPRKGQKVCYQKNTDPERSCAVSALLTGLPEQFELDDGEVVTGQWPVCTEFLYVAPATANFPEVPLVTVQRIQQGHAIWLNSGDHSPDGPPHSIGKPDPLFVTLLDGLLRHARSVVPCNGNEMVTSSPPSG